MYDELTPPEAEKQEQNEERGAPPAPEEELIIMENEKITDIYEEEGEGTAPAQEPHPPEVPEEAQGAQKPRPQSGWWLSAALIPFLALILAGCILLCIRFSGGESDSIFSLTPGEAGEPLGDFLSDAGDEVRGVYIATAYNINYPSAQNLRGKELAKELDAIVASCTENGINAIYFQASPYSDALYDSDILPTSSVLSGKEGAAMRDGFDPLAYLCATAHEAGISVHAWVNPMRVTAGALDYEDLAADNPAKKDPSLTVKYGEEYYYNLGLPEVRKLIGDVCAELAGKYPIDGILFDDYFYPYPEEGQVFDDSAAFEAYGDVYADIGDFRRGSTTALVKECYAAIKEARSDCAFGIAPFGIWQNDDGENGGSATRGFEGYESLYCDALSFIKEGIVDYIAPQIYWTFESEAAPYAALCDWWNAQVSGTDVKLLISHAAYQAAAWGKEEVTEQIAYARERKGYRGSIFYGYAAIAGDEGNIRSQLAAAYETMYAFSDFYSTGEEVVAILRRDGSTVTVKGTSDVAYPLFYGDTPVSQCRDGSFSFTCPTPQDGKITLTQNEKEYTFEINGD